MPSTTIRRVLRGVGANGYSQLVSIVVQIVSVPLFLFVWSLDKYGQWLMIAAIPAYLAMSDFGIVMIAANRVTMLLAAGQAVAARRTFQSAQAFLTAVLGAVGILSTALVLPPILPLPFEHRCALWLLILALICGQIGGLAEAAFRATERFATGVAFSATTRLLEWAGYCVGLWLDGSFIAVAAGGLVARSIMTSLMLYRSTLNRTDLQYGWSAVSVVEIRDMLRPAFSYMAFTLSNALTFQGLTIVAGLFLGPAQLVVFNTYRTMSRVAVQITSALSHAVWPEFSRLFGVANSSALETAYRRTVMVGTGLAVGVGVVTLALSPLLVGVWTHHEVGFVLPLMVIFVIYAAVAGIGHTPRVLLMSTNAHGALALWAIVVSFGTMIIALILTNHLGVYGIVSAMILGEASLVVVSSVLARRFLKEVSRKEDDVLAN